MFCVGDRVVCIDVKPRKDHAPPTGLMEGTVYTIRGFAVELRGIYLEEIINPAHPTRNVEWAYYRNRFAPINNTNIDVFLKMLDSAPEMV